MGNEESLQEYIRKPKEKKGLDFLLQYFGILKFWYLFAKNEDKYSNDTKRIWMQMSNIMKQCHLNMDFFQHKEKQNKNFNAQTKQSRYSFAANMVDIFKAVWNAE